MDCLNTKKWNFNAHQLITKICHTKVIILVYYTIFQTSLFHSMDDHPEINFRDGHFALVRGNLGTQVLSLIA